MALSVHKFLVGFLLLCCNGIQLCDGTKHSYFAKDDERALIGPLGFPFGFLRQGFYNLTVFHFKLTIGVHDEKENDDAATDDDGDAYDDYDDATYDDDDDATNDEDDDATKQRLLKVELDSQLDQINGVGFLLKRFQNEADFNQYMSSLAANGNLCAFEKFLSAEDDDDIFLDGDDTYPPTNYDGEDLNVVQDGIFLNMKNTSNWGPNTASITHRFTKGEEGLYFLIYQICPKPGADIHSHFELDFHFFNYDMFHNESYLSAGEMNLPHVFFYFSILYACAYYLWTNNIKRIQQGEPGHFPNPGGGTPVVYPIHSVMSVLLLLKTLSIFFESIRYHYIRVSGTAELWSFVYYTFAVLKGTLLFTVIVLIGSGWSFVKPFLSERERNMIFVVLFLQVVNNIAIIVLTTETEGEKSFDHWTATLHLVDILCCCAVLIPIVWHVNALEKNIEQNSDDPNSTITSDSDGHDTFVNGTNIHRDDDDAFVPEDEFDEDSDRNKSHDLRLIGKLRLFRSFYLLVVTYIYVTRIVVYLFATMLDYRHLWLRTFVVEAVTFAFYIMVGTQFRPMGENPYLSIQEGDDDDDNDDRNPSVGRARGATKKEVELTA